jgi:hypothetical protein
LQGINFNNPNGTISNIVDFKFFSSNDTKEGFDNSNDIAIARGQGSLHSPVLRYYDHSDDYNLTGDVM